MPRERKLRNLTPLQEIFVSEYLKDFNASKAVLRAGYNTNNPNNQGSQLLNTKHVRARIQEAIEERKEKSFVNEDYVLRKIVNTLEKCEKDENFNATAVLRAAELLAKHLGMFVDKQEISGPNGGAIQTEKVTNDATDFTRSIARLAKRGGARGGVEEVKPGDSSES